MISDQDRKRTIEKQILRDVIGHIISDYRATSKPAVSYVETIDQLQKLFENSVHLSERLEEKEGDIAGWKDSWMKKNKELADCIADYNKQLEVKDKRIAELKEALKWVMDEPEPSSPTEYFRRRKACRELLSP